MFILVANLLMKTSNKHQESDSVDRSNPNSSEDEAISEDGDDEPLLGGMIYWGTVETKHDFILILREMPGLVSNVSPQDTGFRIDWSVERVPDALLTRWGIALEDAHHCLKVERGTIFIQAPKGIECAPSLVQCIREAALPISAGVSGGNFKVIFAPWKICQASEPFIL